MGVIKNFKSKKERCNEVVPLIEGADRHEITLVEGDSIKASCVVIHGRHKEHFNEFATIGIQDGTLSVITMMRLSDVAIAIDKLYEIFTTGMEQLPAEERLTIRKEIADMLGRK